MNWTKGLWKQDYIYELKGLQGFIKIIPEYLSSTYFTLSISKRRGTLMNLLYKGKKLKEGYQTIVSPENSDLKWLEFGRLSLSGIGKEFSDIDKERETALSIFSGKCDIDIDKEQISEKIRYQEIGGRADVFSGAPTMIYIPKGLKYTIKSSGKALDIGIFKAPSRKDTKLVLIKPGHANLITPGAGNWQRKVYVPIGEKVGADRLIVGETFNPPGNWSGFPPHKHDSYNPPKEAPYEEVYFFLLKPAKGFGIQRIYTSSETKDPINEVYVIENNDTVVIPRGYHPVVAAAGYQLYYFWALAGEERIYAAWSDDPKHSWLRNREPILDNNRRR